MTAYEDKFTAFLRDTTPEPPASLVPPNIAALLKGPAPVGDETETHVVEFVRPPDGKRPRNRTWLAAIVAGAAVIVTAVVVAGIDAAKPDGTQAGNGPAVRACSAGQLTAKSSPLSPVSSSGVASKRIEIDNPGSVGCRTTLPTLYLVVSEHSRFEKFAPPSDGAITVVLPAGGKAVLTAQMRVTPRCPKGSGGVLIQATGEVGARYAFSLNTACVTEALSWTYTVSR